MTWLITHWIDCLLHLGLDLTGGLTLRCVMGMCEHKHHQYAAWGIMSVIFSISTVALIG